MTDKISQGESGVTPAEQKRPIQIFAVLSESFIRNDIDSDTVGDEEILQQISAENLIRRLANFGASSVKVNAYLSESTFKGVLRPSKWWGAYALNCTYLNPWIKIKLIELAGYRTIPSIEINELSNFWQPLNVSFKCLLVPFWKLQVKRNLLVCSQIVWHRQRKR